jgi:adhesin/invasin
VPVAPAVVVRDAAGTPVAGLPVAFVVASGGGSVTGGDAVTDANGVATVGRWTLGGSVGGNTLRATVAADNVNGNPVVFTATAVPGAPSADKSSVSASPGTIGASAGSDGSDITVIVRDSRGNPLPAQGVTLDATGDGVSLTQPGPTDASGTTTGRFSATTAGDHTISASVAGTTIGRATVTVVPGAPVAPASAAAVPAGTAGVPTQVDVTLKDQFGNPVPGAAGQITVAVSGANPVTSVDIEDRGGGAYRASYRPVRVGVDQVDVRVGGQAVPGSPFASAVAPGAPDPGRTTADVPDGTFGQTLEFVVHVADSEGNPVGHGGDQVAVSIQGVTDGALPVQDAGDGTYHATWRPFVFGNFQVQITLNGVPIAGSPFTTRIDFFR